MGEQFSLPLGVINGTEVTKDVVLKPMTAKTRRILTTRKNQRSPATAISRMIASCCESIAGVEATDKLLMSLCSGDRDFLLLKLRAISLGNIVTAQMNCPRCSQELSFEFDLDEIKVREFVKDKDYEIEDGMPVVTLENPDLNLVVKMRLPTGYDQDSIKDQFTADPLGASYALYSRVLRQWTVNGEDQEGINALAFIDNLSIREIEWLESSVKDVMPGPDWTVKLNCDMCSKSTILDLSDSDFLFKTQR